MGNAVIHFELMSREPERHRPARQARPVAGMGKFSLFTDPEGRMMGLWKAKAR